MREFYTQQFGGIPVADHFEARLKDRKAYKETLEEQGREDGPITFNYRSGDYGQSGLVQGQHEFRNCSSNQKNHPCYYNHRSRPADLIGLENFISKQAQKLFALKEDKPVVILDMGGMVGLSWSRIALAFQKEIKDSQIAFIVSNLVYQPRAHLEEESSGLNRFDEIPVLREAEPLVHYLNGDASDLGSQFITLPNGRKIPLAGNIDIIHERLALTYWSYVPELEILEAANLLSQYGTYLIERGKKWVGSSNCDHLKEKEELLSYEARREGIQLGFIEIQKRFGLMGITTIEYGDLAGTKISNLWIFRKPDAPEVEANLASNIPVQTTAAWRKFIKRILRF